MVTCNKASRYVAFCALHCGVDPLGITVCPCLSLHLPCLSLCASLSCWSASSCLIIITAAASNQLRLQRECLGRRDVWRDRRRAGGAAGGGGPVIIVTHGRIGTMWSSLCSAPMSSCLHVNVFIVVRGRGHNAGCSLFERALYIGRSHYASLRLDDLHLSTCG